MTTQEQAKSGYRKWQDGIDKAAGNPAWDAHDCEIRNAVAEINRHLSGITGFIPLDWQLIKAMIWTETGAAESAWKFNPMQIGLNGDPGLLALLSGKEGGDLVLPPAWKKMLTAGSARTIPSHNLRAGIGYLVQRLGYYAHQEVLAPDTRVYQATVKAGDSLSKIAKQHGTTTGVLQRMNPGSSVLRPGQSLQYRKASVQRVITGWRTISTAQIAARYNSGGDADYARKLDYALGYIRKRKGMTCAQ